MSIVDVPWSNPHATVAEDLQKLRDQALVTGYEPLDTAVVANILRAAAYVYKLNRKRLASEARRRKKRYKR